jgi:ribosome-associated translation inhibitor RaiA
MDVELLHERNPRQSGNCQRVEITSISRGPIVRAEACAGDFYSALDLAAAKLDTRLRKLADRRRVHRGGKRAPVSVATATGKLAEEERSRAALALDEVEEEPEAQPWHVVRLKEHPAQPMTVDDALFQMEMVGHDFYLFMDKDSGRPSVVYRRKAYDYGVISLSDEAVSEKAA